ncbi:MAG: hypothetical protein LBI26_01905 [Holosporales bacterium]|jgi:peptidoglycan hydrolase CwlO-like protein|nr:hypothetical protein [Holosporales bacterium]
MHKMRSFVILTLIVLPVLSGSLYASDTPKTEKTPPTNIESSDQIKKVSSSENNAQIEEKPVHPDKGSLIPIFSNNNLPIGVFQNYIQWENISNVFGIKLSGELFQFIVPVNKENRNFLEKITNSEDGNNFDATLLIKPNSPPFLLKSAKKATTNPQTKKALKDLLDLKTNIENGVPLDNDLTPENKEAIENESQKITFISGTYSPKENSFKYELTPKCLKRLETITNFITFKKEKDSAIEKIKDKAMKKAGAIQPKLEQLKVLQEEREELTLKKEKLEAELSALSGGENSAVLTSQINETKENLTKAEEELQKKKEELEEAKKKQKEAENDLEKKKNTLNNTPSTIISSAGRRGSTSSPNPEYTTAESEVKSAQTALNAATDRVSALEKEVEEKQKTVTELTSKLKTLTTELKDEDKSSSPLKKDLEGLRNRIQEIDKKIEEIEKDPSVKKYNEYDQVETDNKIEQKKEIFNTKLGESFNKEPEPKQSEQ